MRIAQSDAAVMRCRSRRQWLITEDQRLPANPLLDNIAWHALTGPQAAFAEGCGPVRRYARGFAPIVAFAEPEQPDFAALSTCTDDGEAVHCNGWTGTPTAGWQVDAEFDLVMMSWEGAIPAVEAAPQAVALGPEHAAQAFELALLTRPGPFGPRTIELGEYFGVFDGPRLVAMAGERMHAGSLREISGVCTHPDHQGRGFARMLMLELIGRQMRRGETPILHVMRHNTGAHRLYERMGFRNHRESVVRVILRRSATDAA